MRNINIISIPGEGSVNFSTSAISSPTLTSTITVTGLSANAISFAGVTGLEAGMAIQFVGVGSLTGVSTATTYWVHVATGSPTTSITLYSDYLQSVAVTIGGSAGGATFTIFSIGAAGGARQAPKYFTYTNSVFNDYFMIDGLGQTWSNHKLTTSGFWTYTGLTGTADTFAGTGLVFYQATDGTGFVFAFNSQSIDFFSLQTYTWTWGWKPSDGTNHQTNYLHANSNHEAQVAPDSKVYFCDGNWVCGFFQLDPTVAFVPGTKSTYTFFQQQALVPTTDTAISLSYIGANILIGGKNNIVYSWDGTSSGAVWILLPEYNVKRMITVNTNCYIFVGNRGRIYVTNGTGAQLFKKIPDHISGTIEPYFTWGGACSTKNQLYFSASATTNSGSANSQYGGLWAIDLDTKAMRLTNQLSYATYAGSATAMMPNFGTNPSGTGLYLGWENGSSVYGIDTTSSSPYTTSVATIDSDLIPLGTYTHTRDVTNIEYRLTTPLVSGESITIKTRLIFNTQNTGYTTTLTDSTVGNYSNKGDINFLNAQWVQFQIVLNSTASTPSYVRLKHIRILGLTGPTLASAPQLGL